MYLRCVITSRRETTGSAGVFDVRFVAENPSNHALTKLFNYLCTNKARLSERPAVVYTRARFIQEVSDPRSTQSEAR